MKENPFCTSSHKFYIKDKSMINHWVRHSIIKHINVDELFNIKLIINELIYSLNYYDEIDALVVA